MKVFIAGPRAITKLNKTVEERLFNIYEKKITVLVGDANGVDKSIQQYFHKLSYSNVRVYASQGKARNNVGGWEVETVEVSKKLKGFDYYAEKDKAMAKEADYGFMLWNGKSKGTLNNIINLIKDSKKSLVYFAPKGQFVCIDGEERLEWLISFCDDETKVLYKKLSQKTTTENPQLTLFDVMEDEE